MLDELVLEILSLLALMRLHSPVEHSLLPGCLDLVNSLHGLYGLHHEVSVVSHGHIPPLLKLKHCVACHFFSVGSSVSFSPSQLSWVLLCFKKLVALGWAETEYFGVITGKSHTVTWVNAFGAEVALFDSHYYWFKSKKFNQNKMAKLYPYSNK